MTFVGVIDPVGFSMFEFRELEGKLEPGGGGVKYIFADDFYIAGSALTAPAIPAPIALPLMISALGLLAARGRRRGVGGHFTDTVICGDATAGASGT
jgi:hypothetical protein